jgi:uncharacterized protein with FMN-binding domain
VRPVTALGVTLASAAVLGAAWKAGSDSGSGSTNLAGVQTISPSGTATGATTSPSSAGTTSGSSTGSTSSKTRTSSSHSSSSHTSSSHPSSSTPKTLSFTGSLVSTPYGDVQVRAVLTGTKLVDVVAVQLTDHGGRSVSISAHAAPILRTEALSAQSAKISAVSGASYTSAGYTTSLQAALDAARAAGV